MGVSGDGFVTLADGSQRWGRFGAAGILVRHVDPEGEPHYFVALRSAWTHHGGTWAVPGGALNHGETPLEGALRGYKEINLRALQRLVPGGVLATYTCSHHMQDAELRQVLAEASADAKRRLRVLEWCHQPPDHPVLMTMPESEYLRGYIVRVM